MRYALEIENLNKKYKYFALEDVSFRMPENSIMGFVGPNGAGKTTTIKSILNLVNYDSGEIKIFGNTYRNRKVSGEVGIVMDGSFYEDDWRITDISKIYSLFHKEWDAVKFDNLLSEFKLDKRKKVKELSRGMNVKLMIATALSHGAKLLVLDEPTSGLDPVSRDELRDMLLNYKNKYKCSILFSTHITTDLEKVADYITLILDGKIILSQDKESLLKKYLFIKGVKDDGLNLKEVVIGYKEIQNEFSGLIESENLADMPKGIEASQASLEDIIIFTNRGFAKRDFTRGSASFE